MKNTILFLLLFINSSILSSQILKNDLEIFNLKGNVKTVLYEKIYVNHIPIFMSHYDAIGYNYYFNFNNKGNLISHGRYVKDSLTQEIRPKTKSAISDKMKYKYNPNSKLFETSSYYSKGFYKGYIKNKTVYEYSPFRITIFNSTIDTTDLGYQYINMSSKNFNEKEHTQYKFYKEQELLYNDKKQLVKVYLYYKAVVIDGLYDSKYDKIIEFEYDEFGNLISRIEGRAGCDEYRSKESYDYKFDSNNNWIQKIMICSKCINEKDKTVDVINREIIYN